MSGFEYAAPLGGGQRGYTHPPPMVVSHSNTSLLAEDGGARNGSGAAALMTAHVHTRSYDTLSHAHADCTKP